ncbi:MAG: HPr family phosphocarrier protein [bacterium]|nr:HPr family phosphocarrier protein [bacterium]
MEKTIKIKNKLGLHARAAALFVQTTNKYESEIFVKIKGEQRKVNGKSIMGMMMLAVTCGKEIIIETVGKDEEVLLGELTILIENKFGEE